MLGQNRYIQDAKRAKGRNLTQDEVIEHRKEFQALFDESDQDIYAEAYRDWRRGGGGEAEHQAQRKPYAMWWGGGSRASPVTPDELCKYIVLFGWP
eukprot:9488548-Pyramimonas_sp.AAC.1